MTVISKKATTTFPKLRNVYCASTKCLLFNRFLDPLCRHNDQLPMTNIEEAIGVMKNLESDGGHCGCDDHALFLLIFGVIYSVWHHDIHFC